MLDSFLVLPFGLDLVNFNSSESVKFIRFNSVATMIFILRDATIAYTKNVAQILNIFIYKYTNL
jgi:hypothetical protein